MRACSGGPVDTIMWPTTRRSGEIAVAISKIDHLSLEDKVMHCDVVRCNVSAA